MTTTPSPTSARPTSKGHFMQQGMGDKRSKQIKYRLIYRKCQLEHHSDIDYRRPGQRQTLSI
eukprot:3575872-Prorocentrum_lima.AAC.1